MPIFSVLFARADGLPGLCVREIGSADIDSAARLSIAMTVNGELPGVGRCEWFSVGVVQADYVEAVLASLTTHVIESETSGQ